jgi:uncharacterized delta-60 repeat protein
VTETQEKFMSWKLQNLASGTGWAKLGLLILAGLIVANAGRAQTSFYSPQVLAGDYGSVTNDNSSVKPPGDPSAPSIAGFAPNRPLWFQWTASSDGEVELDTIGSLDDTNGTPLNTVLAVFTGTNLTTLNQVAANDDLFPINSSLPLDTEGYSYSGSGDYAKFAGPGSEPVLQYIQPYYGPSHLRFNAQAGVTYYIAVDSQTATSFLGFNLGSGPGTVVLNWAYKSSGVFRFASEDVDYSTGYPLTSGGAGHLTGFPLYQAAETEGNYLVHYVPVGNSPLFTYYNYNVPGVLVTVTRVAGSTGRATVNYQTMDGASLASFFPPGVTNFLPVGDVGAVAGLDYIGVTNTLVFDDYEMSKTILVPILNPGIFGSGGDLYNTVFGMVLSNPQLDPNENGDVAPPRVDPSFNVALVKILNVNADPYGPDLVPILVTNGVGTNAVVMTNIIIAAYPTNPVVNFQKCNFRVPEDVNDPANPNGYTTPVTIYVERSQYATNHAALTLHYRVNNFVNSDADPDEEWNNWFPLQPASDYAVPTPPNYSTILASNSDFAMTQGTITFPANGVDEYFQPITFTVTNSTLTKFNRDFKVQLYQLISLGNQTVPALQGMVAETTVTILFNDQHPPAGSVDELYDVDNNHKLALPPNIVQSTLPNDDFFPGVAGLVNSLLVLPDNETLIAGDFPSFNSSTFNNSHPINSIALIATNGALDQSFSPDSGADDGPINSMASTPGNQFIVGGNFTSFNGVSRGHVARVNADGSLDMSFNASADGNVMAVAVQPDGKVLIGGNFQNVNGQTRDYLARLNTDGSLDTTFDPSNTLNGTVYALALPTAVIASITRNAVGNSNEDDQILNLGNYTAGTLTVNYDMFTAPDDMRIFYGDTNVAAGTGVLIYDTGLVSFSNTLVIPIGPVTGVAGLLTTNLITIVMNQGGQAFTTQWKYTASVAPPVTTTGIMVGGSFGVNGQSYVNIARFITNGMLDTTFSPLSGADNPVYALGWQVDGKVVAGGAFTHFNGIPNNRLVRLNPDGSLDNTNFFAGTGADDTVWNITLQPLDGTIYVGGQFRSFNGTHRAGFTRLYPNGTVDTTFLDTAYNQFAGLKRMYSWETPAVYASGIQSDGSVMIGGSFNQVGGGQASTNCDVLDDELGIAESFGDTNLWVEPKVRDGVRNRGSIARLIGGSTPGPGSIAFQTTSYSANKSQSVIPNVGLVRTNGVLGPISANFSIQPGTAQSGADYFYDSTPPQFWIAWRYTTSTGTRLRGDGLFGGNGFLQDVFSSLSLADALINDQSVVTVSVIKDPLTLGNLNAQFQLANPSGADEFYLGGQNIPLGAALGQSTVPFTLIDDTKQAGTFGFASTLYVATNIYASISVGRSNGIYGAYTLYVGTSNGTAIAGVDYTGFTNYQVFFPQGVVSNSFAVTNRPNGLISTNFVEKTVNLRVTKLTGPGDGNVALGLTNAVLRLINPNFPGYLTLSATNYLGSEKAGFIAFVVNRVAGNLGTLTVQYATTNGPTATNGVDYVGATNTLQWNSGDASSRIVTIPLINSFTVGPNKQFGVLLFNPTLNGTNQPGLFYVGTPPTNSIVQAALVITNDNSYGAFQFSAPGYVVNENGGYATITVLRTGGTAGPVSVNYATGSGANTAPGVNYDATNGTLVFAANQTAASFNVTIHDDGVQDPTNFYFTVNLSNPTNAVLGSPSSAVVNILDAETYNRPPGSPDGTFDAGMNGDVLALALQPNGQILAGGSFTFVNGVPENSIARLNADGSLDSAGFLNGLAGANGTVQAVVCQTDGRVLIGGSFTSADGITRNHIARLMTDGSLDTSFNPGPAADAPVYALAEAFINGAREIYVGGAFNTIGGTGNYSPNLARLNNGGSFDGSFAVGAGPNAPVYAIAVYPTNSPFAGKLLVGGAFTNINGSALGHVARMNGDGSVDTSFALNLGANDTVRAIAIQNDGRILIGGDFTNVNGVILNHVARLNSDGSLDINFTANFTNNVDLGVNDTVQTIAVQADNRIVVAGQFTQANGVTRSRITRLLPNGAADPTVNFGDGANGTIDALVIQPADQNLVIGGGFTQYDDQPAAHIARIYGGSMTGSGVFEFTSAGYQVLENGGQALITVRRTGGTSGPNPDGSGNVSVQFATVNGGSAVPGVNYSNVMANLVFPPGEVLESVAVPVMDDGIVTSNLTVNLALSNPTPPAAIGPNTAILTIINVESAVSFSTANYSVTKDVLSGFGTLDVVRLGGTNGTCSVDFLTTTNGTAVTNVDFYPTNVTVTFNPGDTDKPVQVPIINNNIPEGYRTAVFALTNAVNTLLYSPSNATLTIIDTVNAPGQFSFSATNYTVNETDGTAYLTVLRTNGTSGTVSVTCSTVPGTAQPGVSYVTTTSTLTFNNLDTSKTFAVPLVQNNLVLGMVNFSVVLSLSSSTNGATLIAPTNATVNILDKNTGFAFAAATNTVIETAGFAAVNVLRIGATSNPAQVSYTTANGTAASGVNYTAQSGTLVFGTGESLRSVQIPLIYDPQVTGPLYFTIVLSNPSVGTSIVAPATNTVVELDADAGLSFTNSTTSVLKSAGSAVITVVCSNTAVEPVVLYSNGVPVTTPLSVQYSTANGTATAGIDYLGVSGTLVFTNGIGTNTFTVPIINNGSVTGNRTFTVSLSNPTPPGQLVSPSNQVVTIIDSNSGLSFSNATFTVLKSGVAANINVFRTGYTDSVVAVNFLATNGTALAGIQYVATNGTLIFTNGVTNLAFSVPIIDTAAVQPDETVLLELFNPTNGFLVPPSAATLTIHDTSGSFVVPAGSALVSETGAGAPNGIIDSNETVTVLFAFRDAGGTNVTDLTATLLATNGVTSPTSPNGTPTQDYGPLAYGGHSVSRLFTFTAHGTNNQQIAATFSLTNVTSNIGLAVFGYTLGTWTTVVSNTALITISADSAASPYPSTINISGLGGSLVKATITLTNLWHSSPEDIDALLVSPSQLNTLFMAHAGGQNALQNVTITFDDAASNSLPHLTPITTIPNAVITNKPTAYLPVQPFP